MARRRHPLDGKLKSGCLLKQVAPSLESKILFKLVTCTLNAKLPSVCHPARSWLSILHTCGCANHTKAHATLADQSWGASSAPTTSNCWHRRVPSPHVAAPLRPSAWATLCIYKPTDKFRLTETTPSCHPQINRITKVGGKPLWLENCYFGAKVLCVCVQ